MFLNFSLASALLSYMVFRDFYLLKVVKHPGPGGRNWQLVNVINKGCSKCKWFNLLVLKGKNIG
jgi:hypothetical protein